MRLRESTIDWVLPYPYEILAVLDEHGVEMVVDGPIAVRQFGRRRAARPGDAATVYAVVGRSAPADGVGGKVHLARVDDTPDGPVTVIFDPG